MNKIYTIDRQSFKIEEEEVYGIKALEFLYGDDLLSRLLGPAVLNGIVKWPWFSQAYGWWQAQPWSRSKVLPFIKDFKLDMDDYAKKAEEFTSFNDFFTRKLKEGARSIVGTEKTAVMPADGRYTFYPKIEHVTRFKIKGKEFNLSKLLGNLNLAKQYEGGSMLFARLCPTDYHRYHFPIDCIPQETEYLPGPLFSVNPIALKKSLRSLTENRRNMTRLLSPLFGNVLFLEIGATNVGSIIQTYKAGKTVKKGDEKGYFAFGGSALIILFEPDMMTFDSDLLEAQDSGYEVHCLMGQSLGSSNK
jgi:phosphatidylserine decarboxylase